MTLGEQVRRVIAAEQISETELADMVRRSAIITHPRGNRRFHDWLFQFDKPADLLQNMCKFELTDYASGFESVEEDCEDCDGAGCVVCGWNGVVKRLS